MNTFEHLCRKDRGSNRHFLGSSFFTPVPPVSVTGEAWNSCHSMSFHVILHNRSVFQILSTKLRDPPRCQNSLSSAVLGILCRVNRWSIQVPGLDLKNPADRASRGQFRSSSVCQCAPRGWPYQDQVQHTGVMVGRS